VPLLTRAVDDLMPSQASDSDNGSGGLYAGAKVGVGVGLSVGIAFLVISGLTFWSRVRKHRLRTGKGDAKS
jgi:hypothetical protein